MVSENKKQLPILILAIAGLFAAGILFPGIDKATWVAIGVIALFLYFFWLLSK
jgi:hypothetical protein